MGELRWGFSALLARKKGKVETSPFLFLQASLHIPFPPGKYCREAPPFFLSKERLQKYQCLQNLGCQKPYWDQARLSSLVWKHVALSISELGPSKLNKAKFGLKMSKTKGGCHLRWVTQHPWEKYANWYTYMFFLEGGFNYSVNMWQSNLQLHLATP